MAGPIFKLEEQLSDQRSNQIAYKLTIENNGSAPIRLLSVDPRIPVGARLVEITDTSLAQAHARKVELLDELNLLLRQFLWVTSAEFRKIYIDRSREALKDIYSFSGLLRGYAQLVFSGTVATQLKRDLRSIWFKIDSTTDADSAYEKWLRNSTEYEAIRSVFHAKKEQLSRIEAMMNEGDRPGLTSIEAMSYFTATYVLEFRRGLLEPRKYQVGFEATYQPSDGSQAQSGSAATNVQISPFPINLSIVAIASALLGALLKVSLSDKLQDGRSLFFKLRELAESGEIWVGPVVALIFFNVYEYTSLGKGIAMSISWRSALFIGALCGIGQDRVLAAMRALIGG